MPGEGSHGGVVIGHTRSGAPIYQDHRPDSTEYRPFLPGDHAAAAMMHQKLADAATDVKTSAKHGELAAAHRAVYDKAVTKLRQKGSPLLSHSREYKAQSFARSAPSWAKSEGSRGGVVVGHTSGGRPIYSARHATQYPHFTASDHGEAARAHEQAGHAAKQAGDAAQAALHGAMRYSHVKAAMRRTHAPELHSLGVHVMGYRPSAQPTA